MAHFIVLVIGDDLEGLLAPYQFTGGDDLDERPEGIHWDYYAVTSSRRKGQDVALMSRVIVDAQGWHEKDDRLEADEWVAEWHDIYDAVSDGVRLWYLNCHI